MLAGLGLAASVRAQAPTDVTEESWNIKFQATYVWQFKDSFAADYSGAHSLSTSAAKSYSFTSTAALGLRPWAGGEFYLDPEVAQGVPLSGLSGLGAFTNGEVARSAGPTPTVYRARSFVRQTWGFGGTAQTVQSDANQLAGSVDSQRLVLTVGTLSVLDIFDNNTYAHDPRTQFLNWVLMTHGAYDYPADARGYSSGLALEYYSDHWALRGGRFAEPRSPNGQQLDARLATHYGDQIEGEYDYSLTDQPGKLRLLAFHSQARMATYADALAQAEAAGADSTTPLPQVPDLNAVRDRDQGKRGLGVNIEQALTDNLGVFARAFWADGHSEVYAFSEIDQSQSIGAQIKGGAWSRSLDTIGIAFARDQLSAAHQHYLGSGGLGFFIGDGALNYHPETLWEAYYNFNVLTQLWLSFDYQYIRNPAYNADRGPVNVSSVRVHTEF